MATTKFDDSEWKEVKIGEYDDRIMSVQEAEEAAYLENALLPCPFCGGHIEARISFAWDPSYNGKVISCRCVECGIVFKFPGHPTQDCVKAIWNGRRYPFLEGCREELLSLANIGGSQAAAHYQLLIQQPIEIMQTLFSADEFRGFLLGNVIKYALRYGHKDERRKEAEKIAQYAVWLAALERGETIRP